MENRPKISVIIPVYNVSAYIEQCLLSIINQTFKELEIIVIDDCSQDDSFVKIQRIAQSDQRIRVFQNAVNQRAAESRNIGLRNAAGEYIGFVDSDDWIEPNFYEKLYLYAAENNADIAFGNVLRYYPDSRSHTIKWNYKSDRYIAESDQDKDKTTFGIACNKIFRKTLLDTYKIWFPVGVTNEDIFFSTAASMLANKIVSDRTAVYCYRQEREGSVMYNSAKDRAGFDIYKVFEVTDSFLDQIAPQFPDKIATFRQIVDAHKIHTIYTWYRGIYSDFKPEFFQKMRTVFRQLKIKNNGYVTPKFRKIHNDVVRGVQSITDIKLIGAIPLLQLKHKEQSYSIYLFGFIKLFLVKYK